jgi:ketosteroid isomerase-like protein
MSEENVAVAKQTYEAFGRGDLPSVLENFHEDVEWHAAEGLPWGGAHTGRDAVANGVFGELLAAIDDFALDHERYIDGGEFVVALGRYSGKGKNSGKPLDAAFAHVWEFDDGKLKRFLHYTDTAKWQEALS